jgi:hypothetical protein
VADVGERVRALACAHDPGALELHLLPHDRFEDRLDEFPVGALPEVRQDFAAALKAAFTALGDECDRAPAAAIDERFERGGLAALLRLSGDAEMADGNRNWLPGPQLVAQQDLAHPEPLLLLAIARVHARRDPESGNHFAHDLSCVLCSLLLLPLFVFAHAALDEGGVKLHLADDSCGQLSTRVGAG